MFLAFGVHYYFFPLTAVRSLVTVPLPHRFQTMHHKRRTNVKLITTPRTNSVRLT